MRKFFVVFLLSFMATSSSCKKAKRLENKLEGTWELTHMIGFLPPDSGATGRRAMAIYMNSRAITLSVIWEVSLSTAVLSQF